MDQALRKKLFDVLLVIFKKLMKGDYTLYQKTMPRFDRLMNNGMSIAHESVPDYTYTLTMNWPKLTEGIDMTTLGTLWKEQYLQFARIGTRHVGRGIKIRDIIEVMTTQVWMKSIEFEKIETYINQEIDELTHFLDQTDTKTRLVALLVKFYIEDYKKEIQLDNDAIIKKLTEEEIIHYQSDYLKGPDLVKVSQFAIIIDYKDEIIFSDYPSHERSEIIERIPHILDAVVYALNIIKAGAVAVTRKLTEQMDYLGNFLGVYSHSRFDPVIGPQYTLKLKEVGQLITLYKKLLNEDVKLFEIALSRLSESELRLNPIDSIIDSVIGLESLLLRETGDEKYRGEMRWRFSTNYATLFDREERLARRKSALNAYDLRSKIVHGSRLDPNRVKFGSKKVPVTEAAKEIRDMLRYTLKYLIDLPPGINFDSEGFWINRLLK